MRQTLIDDFWGLHKKYELRVSFNNLCYIVAKAQLLLKGNIAISCNYKCLPTEVVSIYVQPCHIYLGRIFKKTSLTVEDSDIQL